MKLKTWLKRNSNAFILLHVSDNERLTSCYVGNTEDMLKNLRVLDLDSTVKKVILKDNSSLSKKLNVVGAYEIFSSHK